jgi:integrase
MRKPFYRKSHNCWYVKDTVGRFIRLDPDEETAHRMWLQMLAIKSLNDRSPFAVLAEAWLQEHESLVSPTKFEMIGGYIAAFLPAADGLTALDITPGLVAKWLAEPKPGRLRKDGSRGPEKLWAQSTRRDAAGAIKRVYRWAHGTGKISRNPLFSFSVPEGVPRVVTVAHDAHELLVREMMKLSDDRTFAQYLIASKCGARPQQIREVTREHVLPDHTAWVFAADEHKTGKRTNRMLVVYLSPCLQTLTRILLSQSRSRSPHLFTNSDGEKWKKDTVAQRMRRLRKRFGLPDDLIIYAYRHTMATEALLAGVPIATVSVLMGHTDTRMVAQRYGHLDQHKQYLIDATAQMAARRFKTG